MEIDLSKLIFQSVKFPDGKIKKITKVEIQDDQPTLVHFHAEDSFFIVDIEIALRDELIRYGRTCLDAEGKQRWNFVQREQPQ